MARDPERKWVWGQIAALFSEAFCLLSPQGPRFGELLGWDVGQGDTQEAEAAKCSVLPIPGTAMVACCDHAQAFDGHGTTRETM